MDQQASSHAPVPPSPLKRIAQGVAVAVATVAGLAFLGFLALAAMFSFGGFQIG